MRFWPAVDPAQLDYERLREMTLAGTLLVGPQAERFQRGGLMALIKKPTSSALPLIAMSPIAGQVTLLPVSSRKFRLGPIHAPRCHPPCCARRRNRRMPPPDR